MSSLNTLLEAAKFLELQEQRQQQEHQASMEAALASIKPISVVTTPPSIPIVTTQTNLKTVTANTSPQTVVISSSNISSSTVLQGPVSFSQTTPPQVVKKIDQDGQVTSTTLGTQPQRRYLQNSFDIMNPLVIDEANTNDSKRKQPPMVFRAGTREVHNKLEKYRRAHLKECFDILKKQIPTLDEKKTSNLSILHAALRYIQALKRKERELEHEMERLAREKINNQQRLAILKKEISSHYDNVDFSKLIPDVVTNSQQNGNAVSDITTTVIETRSDVVSTSPSQQSINGSEKIAIPILAKASIPVVTQNITPIKEVSQPVQTTALSVLPMPYPVNQNLVLQKVAIVPKGLDSLAPLVSTHFITAPQQLNGKVVPLNQYLLKPLVVVSTASPRPS